MVDNHNHPLDKQRRPNQKGAEQPDPFGGDKSAKTSGDMQSGFGSTSFDDTTNAQPTDKRFKSPDRLDSSSVVSPGGQKAFTIEGADSPGYPRTGIPGIVPKQDAAALRNREAAVQGEQAAQRIVADRAPNDPIKEAPIMLARDANVGQPVSRSVADVPAGQTKIAGPIGEVKDVKVDGPTAGIDVASAKNVVPHQTTPQTRPGTTDGETANSTMPPRRGGEQNFLEGSASAPPVKPGQVPAKQDIPAASAEVVRTNSAIPQETRVAVGQPAHTEPGVTKTETDVPAAADAGFRGVTNPATIPNQPESPVAKLTETPVGKHVVEPATFKGEVSPGKTEVPPQRLDTGKIETATVKTDLPPGKIQAPTTKIEGGKIEEPTTRAEVPSGKSTEAPTTRGNDFPPVKNTELPPVKNSDLPPVKQTELPPVKNAELPPTKQPELPPGKIIETGSNSGSKIPPSTTDGATKGNTNPVGKGKTNVGESNQPATEGSKQTGIGPRPAPQDGKITAAPNNEVSPGEKQSSTTPGKDGTASGVTKGTENNPVGETRIVSDSGKPAGTAKWNGLLPGSEANGNAAGNKVNIENNPTTNIIEGRTPKQGLPNIGTGTGSSGSREDGFDPRQGKGKVEPQNDPASRSPEERTAKGQRQPEPGVKTPVRRGDDYEPIGKGEKPVAKGDKQNNDIGTTKTVKSAEPTGLGDKTTKTEPSKTTKNESEGAGKSGKTEPGAKENKSNQVEPNAKDDRTNKFEPSKTAKIDPTTKDDRPMKVEPGAKENKSNQVEPNPKDNRTIKIEPNKTAKIDPTTKDDRTIKVEPGAKVEPTKTTKLDPTAKGDERTVKIDPLGGDKTVKVDPRKGDNAVQVDRLKGDKTVRSQPEPQDAGKKPFLAMPDQKITTGKIEEPAIGSKATGIKYGASSGHKPGEASSVEPSKGKVEQPQSKVQQPIRGERAQPPTAKPQIEDPRQNVGASKAEPSAKSDERGARPPTTRVDRQPEKGQKNLPESTDRKVQKESTGKPDVQDNAVRLQLSDAPHIPTRKGIAGGGVRGFEKAPPRNSYEQNDDVAKAPDMVPHSIREVFNKFQLSLPKRSFHPEITESGNYIAQSGKSTQRLQAFISSGQHKSLRLQDSKSFGLQIPGRNQDAAERKVPVEETEEAMQATSNAYLDSKTKLPKSATQAESNPASSARRMYIVQEGDTPQSIASVQLNDEKLADLIIKINELLFQRVYDPIQQEHVKVLPVGTLILLPNPKDIKEFHERGSD